MITLVFVNLKQQLTNTLQMKKHFFISFLGILLSLSITYFVMVSDSENSESLSVTIYALTSLLGIALSYFIYYTSSLLDKLYSFQKNAGLRLFIGIIAHFVLSFFIIYLLLYLYSSWFEDILNFSVVYNDILIKVGILIFLSILLYSIIYFALYSYNSYTTFQISSVRQERKQIELQLKALKAQLSPHFLFNSLNTISSLIYKDVEQAGVFIRQLAKLYQYTLDSYDLKLVSLEEELAFVNSYLFLIKTRFQESFDFKIQLPKELNQTKVPPLALQMLIENAVKHNQLLKDNPLVVEVSEENGFISITNNITEAPIKVTSFKIGLKNINSRYLLIAGRGIEVSNGKHFQVKIPIIR